MILRHSRASPKGVHKKMYAKLVAAVLAVIGGFAREQPGFIERRYFHDPKTQRWIDLVTWRSAADASAARRGAGSCKATLGEGSSVELMVSPRPARS